MSRGILTQRDAHERTPWSRDGGNGLPLPGDAETTVWLFTCVSCGRRLADPPGLPSPDGKHEWTLHKFDPAEYDRIRRGEHLDYDDDEHLEEP